VTKFVSDVNPEVYFITLLVGMSMSFYAINLDVASLFADLSFSFLALLNLCLYLIYQSVWMNECYILVKKNKNRGIKEEESIANLQTVCSISMPSWEFLHPIIMVFAGPSPYKRTLIMLSLTVTS
jgi:hypothetical protein